MKKIFTVLFICLFFTSSTHAEDSDFQAKDIAEGAGSVLQSAIFGVVFGIAKIGSFVLQPFYSYEKEQSKEANDKYEAYFTEHLSNEFVNFRRFRRYIFIEINTDASFNPDTRALTPQFIEALNHIKYAIQNNAPTKITFYNFKYNMSPNGGSVYDESPRIYDSANNYSINKYCAQMAHNVLAALSDIKPTDRINSESCIDFNVSDYTHESLHRDHKFLIKLEPIF